MTTQAGTSGDVHAQRAYYERTAQHYDDMHVSDHDEHALALALFCGFARQLGAESVLDVGAGTGRALNILARELPEARLCGIEPVAALRAIGHEQGISEAMLIDGDAHSLDFDDDSFDFVIETGVLHHVPDPARAVAEMARVARKGVMISDSNKFGQGTAPVRWGKQIVGTLGLWNAAIWLATRGRMSKWSEGDGVFYSYSVFDNLDRLTAKFPRLIWLTTTPMKGTDLKRGASHLAVLALKER